MLNSIGKGCLNFLYGQVVVVAVAEVLQQALRKEYYIWSRGIYLRSKDYKIVAENPDFLVLSFGSPFSSNYSCILQFPA